MGTKEVSGLIVPESSSERIVIPSRRERFMDALTELAALPPFTNGLEVYATLTNIINRREDTLGFAWDIPRTFLNGERTPRLYGLQTESLHTIPDWPGVTLGIALREIMVVSRYGAIEFQMKDPEDRYGERVPFAERRERVIFEKADFDGHGVWHPKNQK